MLRTGSKNGVNHTLWVVNHTFKGVNHTLDSSSLVPRLSVGGEPGYEAKTPPTGVGPVATFGEVLHKVCYLRYA